MTTNSYFENRKYSRELELMTDRRGGLLFYCPKKGGIIFLNKCTICIYLMDIYTYSYTNMYAYVYIFLVHKYIFNRRNQKNGKFYQCKYIYTNEYDALCLYVSNKHHISILFIP